MSLTDEKPIDQHQAQDFLINHFDRAVTDVR
jgi:hypothetical protein